MAEALTEKLSGVTGDKDKIEAFIRQYLELPDTKTIGKEMTVRCRITSCVVMVDIVALRMMVHELTPFICKMLFAGWVIVLCFLF